MNKSSDNKQIIRHIFDQSQLWSLIILLSLITLTLCCVTDLTDPNRSWQVHLPFHANFDTKLVIGSLILVFMLICMFAQRNVKKLVYEVNNYQQEVEEKNHKISRLKEFSDELIQMMNIKDALNHILNISIEEIGADTASIMLKDKDRSTYRIVASYGLPPDVVSNAQIQLGEAIAGRVAKEGKPIIINSDDISDELADVARRKDSIISSVIVPIRLNDEVAGIINIAKRRSSGKSCFTEQDMGVTTTLANQTSLVLQKIELLDNLRNKIDLLEATVRELTQTRAELIHSERLASIGELSASVAHEIRNPMQIILGRTEMLLEDETDERKTEYLQSIYEHVTRIAGIVTNLLDFSRRSTDYEFKELDICAVVNKTLDMLEPQMSPNGIEIIRDFQSDTRPIIGNADQLQQVFINIILNAFQAMRGTGGELSVSVRQVCDKVKVEFSDTGPGIPQNKLNKIFEPFFTTKPEGQGTGLGLSISSSIVQKHGGSIGAKNRSGSEHGACFCIDFPVKKNAKAA